MEKKYLSFVCFCFFSILAAQTPAFQWSKGTGGAFNDEPFGICTDAGGNVYTAGQFSISGDFDPGPGTVNLTSQGDNDIFISKVDPNGNYVWAKQVGGLYPDNVSSMTNDPAGNLYITGTFAGAVDFDPGPGTFVLSTNGSPIINTYVLKLDMNGNFLWALRVGDGVQNYPTSQAICLDGPGNIYLSGQFTGTRDFDPGPGVSSLVAAGSMVFLLKLDPSGNFVWAKAIGATHAPSVVVDGSGNVYTGGTFFGTGDFDPGIGVSNLISFGNNDGYILKLNSAGNFVWARQFGGTSSDQLMSVALDCYGNVIGAGNFIGTFDANPGTAVSNFTTLSASNDVFVVKLDPGGNFIWADQVGGPTTEWLSFMNTDVAGDIYLTGYYMGFGTDLDPGPDTYTVSPAGPKSLFIEKLTGSGNFVWAFGYGTVNEAAIGNVITIDNSFNVYFSGWFENTIDFNPFVGISNLSPATAFFSDNFILKFSQPNGTPVPIIITSNSPLCSGQTAQLTASGSGTLTWYASPTSTTGISTGAIFVVPNVTANVNYYVNCQVCGFTSTLTPVTVSVNPLPNVTVSAN
ncbi:MAG TPA: hypothetical protein PL029_03080, partial [Bacteroidia bacterium]|nr:hypothetical protein [Bacteroidia bacterium]